MSLENTILKAWEDRNNIPLILDEVVTGFRVSPGGAQQYLILLKVLL